MSTLVCSKQFTMQVAIPVPTPTAYWKLEEASGNRVDSVSGLILSEIFGSPIGSDTGKIGQAVNFPGSSDQELRISGSAALKYQGLGVTMTCWFKLNSFTAGTDEIDIMEMDFSGPSASFYCQYNVSHNNIFLVQWDQSGVANDSVASQTGFPVSLGAWHFFAMWFDPTDKKARYQWDNGTVVVGTTSAAPITTGTTALFVLLNVTGTPNYEIDEVGIWLGGILTANQLTALYNNGNGLRPV